MQFKAPAHLSFVLYGLCTAVSMVFIHHREQSLAPIMVAFHTFLFAFLVCFLSSITALKRKLAAIRAAAMLVWHINWTTAVIWIATFFSLKFVTPSVCLFLFLSAHPLTLILLNRHFNLFNLLRATLLLAGASLHILATTQSSTELLGAALALAGGVVGAIYAYYSKRLQAFDSREILGLRFFLIVLITGCWSGLQCGIALQSSSFYLEFALASLLTITLPLFFLQYGLNHLSLLTSSAYMPLAPVLCFVYDVAYLQKTVPPLLLAAVAILCLAMLLPSIPPHYRNPARWGKPLRSLP